MDLSLTPLYDIHMPTPRRALTHFRVSITQTWESADIHAPSKAVLARMAAAYDEHQGPNVYVRAVTPGPERRGYNAFLIERNDSLKAKAPTPLFETLFAAYEHPNFPAWKHHTRRFWNFGSRVGGWTYATLPFRAYRGSILSNDNKVLARFKCDGLSLKVSLERTKRAADIADEEMILDVVAWIKRNYAGYSLTMPGRATRMPDTLGHYLQWLAVYTVRRKRALQRILPSWHRHLPRVGYFDNGFELSAISIPGFDRHTCNSTSEQEAARIATMDVYSQAGADARCIGWMSADEIEGLLLPEMLAKF